MKLHFFKRRKLTWSGQTRLNLSLSCLLWQGWKEIFVVLSMGVDFAHILTFFNHRVNDALLSIKDFKQIRIHDRTVESLTNLRIHSALIENYVVLILMLNPLHFWVDDENKSRDFEMLRKHRARESAVKLFKYLPFTNRSHCEFLRAVMNWRQICELENSLVVILHWLMNIIHERTNSS